MSQYILYLCSSFINITLQWHIYKNLYLEFFLNTFIFYIYLCNINMYWRVLGRI